MNILLTGGAGYIGSHTAISLVEAGHNVVIFDNFTNSSKKIKDKVNSILNKNIVFVEGDIRNIDLLESTFEANSIEAVIHFAGLKSVSNSINNPIEYYDNNVIGTINLLKTMTRMSIHKLIFSSSATVYGHPRSLPIEESHPLAPTSPYGRTKFHIESMLEDLVKANPFWRIISLRYFNPVGGHQSGLLGENPNGTPNNLMPFITEVAKGKSTELKVFGCDYDTTDGTGVRDYIHVMDLADGHLAALNYLSKAVKYEAFNLGTGIGHSVLEILEEFKKATGIEIKYQVTNRRSGDVASCYAGIEQAKDKLEWRPSRNLYDMCKSSWISANIDNKNDR